MANKPKPGFVNPDSCLLCRDFKKVDAHATKFPRQHVASLSQLAHDLTSPFPSNTDKARVIFAWMHHNIAYDTVGFFGGTCSNGTPDGTLRSGLAVCSGYAGLYAALAAHAGLECVVVGGHGKGYGFTPLQPGQSVPPEEQGHAWNAIRIDDGEWKLCDPCWGAGNVGNDDRQYHKSWTPAEFTKSNEDFGRTHFPQDRSKQLRSDGRTLPWEDYFAGENGGGQPATVYSNIAPREGLSASKFLPALLRIPVDPGAHVGGHVRFQFERVCAHWNPLVQGQGRDFVYALVLGGGDWIPMETNGRYWWLDVPVAKLGKRGEKVQIFTVDTIGGQTGRGVTNEQYLAAKGRKAMGFSGLACWELV